MNTTEETLKHLLYKPAEYTDLEQDEVELLNTFPAIETIPLLKAVFYHEPDAFIRSRAFDALLSFQEFDRVQFLLDLYEQSSIDWQIVCCRRLSHFPDQPAITKLCDLLLHHPEPDVRFVCAKSLASIGDNTAIVALEHARDYDTGVDYETFSIAKEAMRALEQIHQRTATEPEPSH